MFRNTIIVRLFRAELKKLHALHEVDVTKKMNDSHETAELLSFLQDRLDGSIVSIDELSELLERIKLAMNRADVLELYLNDNEDLSGNYSAIHSYDP